MAATLTEVVEAVATQLRTIDDVYVQEQWDGDSQVPALVVMAPSIPAYHQTFVPASNTIRTVSLEVLALAAPVGAGSLLVAQRRLNELADWTGDRSVFAALRADRTLGGVVGDCLVEGFDVAGTEDVNAIGYWAGRFRLTINTATGA